MQIGERHEHTCLCLGNGACAMIWDGPGLCPRSGLKEADSPREPRGFVLAYCQRLHKPNAIAFDFSVGGCKKKAARMDYSEAQCVLINTYGAGPYGGPGKG